MPLWDMGGSFDFRAPNTKTCSQQGSEIFSQKHNLDLHKALREKNSVQLRSMHMEESENKSVVALPIWV